MRCPKCNSRFEVAVFNDIQFERCTNCKGLWFDVMEKEDLVKMQGSETIDVGNEEVGAKFDQLRDISCPRCEIPMISMVDKDQFHISYECCPTCFGTYFDAGEFRDLKEFTVAERFTQMLATLRSNL